MKKIFKIANYDFKRLILNPITIVGIIIVMIFCIVLGFVYKIEPTPAYSATFSAEVTKKVFSDFTSNNENVDTKTKLDQQIEEGLSYLTYQKESLDLTNLSDINDTFQSIKPEIERYFHLGDCAFYEQGVKDDISPILEAIDSLSNFVSNFKSLDQFETNLIFTKAQFESLELVLADFKSINTSLSTPLYLGQLIARLARFDELDSLVQSVQTWHVDNAQLDLFEKKYIDRAKEKTASIFTEMETLNEKVTAGDVENLQNMKNLVTNYKLTCETAKASIEFELKLMLEKEKHLGDLKSLYHFDEFEMEDAKLALLKMNYFLQSDELYYTQYQNPLNFNSASYEVTVYDQAYFITSIIGFLTILFGIFCAYKLFGRDRKNGKMDTVLSQNVTFNQVFSGKFLAIIYATSFILLLFSLLSLLFGALAFSSLPNGILAVFNLTSVYTIHPILFFLIKIIGIELQVIFYSVITVFLMNISRKFNLTFAIALILFGAATVCNIFLNGSLVYCLFPFIHADLTSFLGGATMKTGFLVTSLYAYGNFFISLVYYLVIVVLLYNFTKQLFKKN